MISIAVLGLSALSVALAGATDKVKFETESNLGIPAPQPERTAAIPLNWESAARLSRRLGSVPGTLKLDSAGIEFSSTKGFSRRWPFIDIQTLDLWPHQVLLSGYEKRGRLRPGVRRYLFELESPLSPELAAELARGVGRPVRNGVPKPEAPSFAEVPARHRTAFGGTRSNGVLCFRDEGIDYLTKTRKGSRSWRWVDIRTLSNADPYHLVLFGYRDIFSFDLKRPLTRELFDRLSDAVFAHNAGRLESSGAVGH